MNQNHTVFPKIETEFLGSSEIPTFFQPKNRWSQKKKNVFTEIETDFPAEIGNSNVFSAKNRWCPKTKKKVFTEIDTDFWAEIENSKVFLAQKQVISKKKKVFTEIETDFLAGIGNSKVFSAQKQKTGVLQKKKKLTEIVRLIFRPKSEILTLFQAESRHVLHNFGTQFSLGGGLFSIFYQKLASKAPKTCDFAYFTSQWGGSSPPTPLATLLGVFTVQVQIFLVLLQTVTGTTVLYW